MSDGQQDGVSPYIGVEEVAKRLHMSTRGVYELTRTGAIPHRRLPGTKRCLFVLAELEEWEQGADLEVVRPRMGGRIVRPVGTRPVRAPSRTRMAEAGLAA